jgi:hypothetical protein
MPQPFSGMIGDIQLLLLLLLFAAGRLKRIPHL